MLAFCITIPTKFVGDISDLGNLRQSLFTGFVHSFLEVPSPIETRPIYASMRVPVSPGFS